MKKTSFIVFFLIGLAVLSGCSLRSDAADLYTKESPLQVEVNTPEQLVSGKEIVLQAVLQQEGELLETADFVHFEVWNQDGSVRFPMEEASNAGEGVYELAVEFENDGLYYLEVHAGNNGSLVSPQHQFVVGELSDRELESLQKGPAPAEGAPEHHH